VVGTKPFQRLGAQVRERLGIPDLPLVLMPHPLGGISREDLDQRAELALPMLVQSLTSAVTAIAGAVEAPPAPPAEERHEVPDELEAINDYFLERGWSDGLPVIPPTPERVERYFRGTDLDPERILGEMPPKWGPASLRALATNAVMAGCRPAYFPVLIAAVEAVLDPDFNLLAIQATTHPVAPLLIVSGPIARSIELNSGSGCFGPGWQANATIGRALRLVLMNVGGARPGITDMSTQGQPSKYSYCIAENEAENPWESLHMARGFAREESVVTVFGGENPHNIQHHTSEHGSEILIGLAAKACALGANHITNRKFSQVVVALGPEHAAQIAGSGYSRADAQRFIYEHAQNPRERLQAARYLPDRDFPESIPAIRAPEDVLLLVAGGTGRHSCVIPSFGNTQAVSRKIEWKGPG
jgi:hypothetical protein